MGQLLGNNETVIAHHGLPRGPHSRLAICGQGNVTDTSVAPTEGPLGFTVADDEDAGSCHLLCGIVRNKPMRRDRRREDDVEVGLEVM